MARSEDFGDFFRARRKALGLSQSEFCRRNGFDKGNISRLERGLVPPPQDQRLLESYARALKLDERDRRMGTLLRSGRRRDRPGSGRSPRGSTNDARASKALTERRERGGSGTSPMSGHWTWKGGPTPWMPGRPFLSSSESLSVRPARPRTGRIPGPRRRSIAPAGMASSKRARRMSSCRRAAAVWEMGVDKDPRKKAEEDFDDRTKTPDDLDKKQTTFVFVTPRKWQEKEEWRRAKEALGVWKEVRVYDSASLEEWLEQAPVVNAWLAEVLGKKPPGASPSSTTTGPTSRP